MNAKVMGLFIALVLSVGICIPSFTGTVDSAIGYYSSADSTNCRPPVVAFCNEINASTLFGPTVGYVNRFTTNNDSYWDNYSFGFVCAPGNQMLFALSNGYVYLDNLTNGWGDNNMEWGILYCGQLMSTPLDDPNWYQPWITEPDDVFDGLHILNGFHSYTYTAPSVSVTLLYCDLVNTGGYIIDSWFDAIYAEAYYWTQYDQGCSLFYGDCEYDELTDYNSPDPPANQTTDFHCRYM